MKNQMNLPEVWSRLCEASSLKISIFSLPTLGAKNNLWYWNVCGIYWRDSFDLYETRCAIADERDMLSNIFGLNPSFI